MQIGLSLYGSLDLPSGGFNYDRRMVAYLRARAEKVTVIEMPWRRYLAGLLENWSPLPDRLHRGQAVDIWLQDELAHPSLITLNQRWQRLRRKQGGPPVVALVHLLHWNSQNFPVWQRQLYRAAERLYLRSVDGMVYVSQHNQRQVDALTGRVAPAVIVPPGGDHFNLRLDPQAIYARAIEPGALRLVTCGAVVRRKGLYVLLRALATLPPNSWELAVIGGLESEPGYVRWVQRLAEQPPLAGHVRFLGNLPNEEVANQMQAGQVFVLPSLAEGYPLVCVEALACGLPVIATTFGGAPEILQHGQQGYLVPPRDPAALAQALHQLLANRQMLAEMSLAAWRHAAHHLTWDQAGERLHTFLKEMVARQRGGRRKP